MDYGGDRKVLPAGDLWTKQESAAGHRWASIINFAAGYYAVPLDDDTVPYVAFYVEGRGYYVYLHMPFSLTGAPATFCEMVVIALDDMIGRKLVNWMDDICLPGDVFKTKLSNLWNDATWKASLYLQQRPNYFLQKFFLLVPE